MRTKRNAWIYLLMLMGFILIFSNSCKKDDKNPVSGETITDIDGNIYHLVTIGDQVWMAENLKVKHYRNGDSIQTGSGLKNLAVTDTTGAFWTYNNSVGYISEYGLLYNWYAANDARSIAPLGFHVPSDAEFGALVNSLGGDYYRLPDGDTVAGSKLKETGTDYWGTPNDPNSNVGATNSSKWGGRGGGLRYLGSNGYIFRMMTTYGIWWSTTSLTGVAAEFQAHSMILFENKKGAGWGWGFKDEGFSVRCIKDKR